MPSPVAPWPAESKGEDKLRGVLDLATFRLAVGAGSAPLATPVTEPLLLRTCILRRAFLPLHGAQGDARITRGYAPVRRTVSLGPRNGMLESREGSDFESGYTHTFIYAYVYINGRGSE